MTLFTVEMLPARQGDALWLEWGDPERPCRAIVDAGTPGAWPEVRKRIEALPSDQRRFELLVVTHIDDDHIGGVLPLLGDETLGATFGDVWFNGWKHLPDTFDTFGPVQGEALTDLIRDRPWNEAFGGAPIAAPASGDFLSHDFPGGLTLTVIAPGPEQLANLKPVWAKVVREAGLDPDAEPEALPAPPGGFRAFGAEPVPEIDELAGRTFKEDRKEANGSSIVLLAEVGERRALLCGDAFPSVVLRAYERVGRPALSALKVPHHGSKKNVDLALLDGVACEDFLFSSNGTRHGHPDQESVARVLKTHPGARLWFNYDTSFTKVWGRPDVRDRYGHTATYGEAGRLAVPL